MLSLTLREGIELKKIIAGLIAAATISAATASPSVAATKTPTGTDVASHQHAEGIVNWYQVPGEFTFVKATEGTGYINPYFFGDANLSRLVGKTTGTYHYAKPGYSSGAAQAHYYLNTLLAAPGPKLLPVLDIEESDGLSPVQLQNWIRDFVSVVKKRTGRDTIIYTYPNFWDSQVQTDEFSNLPLWIAHYGISSPRIPGGWKQWTFWQDASDGSVPGITGPVDTNRFNGTKGQLAKFIL